MKESNIIHHCPELWFTVVASPKEYRVYYYIYDIAGSLGNGNYIWNVKEYSGDYSDMTENLEEAEIYLKKIFKHKLKNK